MTKRRPVLSDHKREGKVLVPPLVAALGHQEDVGWRHALVPELLWLVLLNEHEAGQPALRLAGGLAASARATASEHARTPFGRVSEFAALSESDWVTIRLELAKSDLLEPIRSALRPLAAFYPEVPLGQLWGATLDQDPVELDALAASVGGMFRRDRRAPMLAQAVFVWLHLNAGVLHIQATDSLNDIREIEQYPDTEKSRMVGSSIRATVNALAHRASPEHAKGWSTYFWKRGLELRACRTDDD